MKWNVLASQNSSKDLLTILLKNRGVSDKELNEFLNPPIVTEYFKKFPVEFKSSIQCAGDIFFKEVSGRKVCIYYGGYGDYGGRRSGNFEQKRSHHNYYRPPPKTSRFAGG